MKLIGFIKNHVFDTLINTVFEEDGPRGLEKRCFSCRCLWSFMWTLNVRVFDKTKKSARVPAILRS